MTFSVMGRHSGAKPIGILTHSGDTAREAVRFANALRQSGMIITIVDDDTGNTVSLEALTVLAETMDQGTKLGQPRTMRLHIHPDGSRG